MAEEAALQIKLGSTDPFYDSKLKVGRVFLERILPDAQAHLIKMKAGSDGLMLFPEDQF